MSFTSLAETAVPDPVRVPSHACCIDLVHLSCMTMGDKGLERDVLDAYAAQAQAHRQALSGDDGERMRRAAHMLVGSSRAIGAHGVASRAEACEAKGVAAVPALIEALDDATAFIARMQG